MSDNKKIPGPEDRLVINVNEPYEVRDWSQKFGVTPQELKNAVGVVGTNAAKVKAYLSK